MNRSAVVEHVVLMPVRIKTQWEGNELIAVLPGWLIPNSYFMARSSDMSDALCQLEQQLYQYWGYPKPKEELMKLPEPPNFAELKDRECTLPELQAALVHLIEIYNAQGKRVVDAINRKQDKQWQATI